MGTVGSSASGKVFVAHTVASLQTIKLQSPSLRRRKAVLHRHHFKKTSSQLDAKVSNP